jgi:two-component system chemotaxis sensor kinase CheA
VVISTNEDMQLIEELKREINSARAGSDAGQFPIFVLLGDIREQVGEKGPEALKVCCNQAWEKMLQITESGKPFNAADLSWLGETVEQINQLKDEKKVAATVNSPTTSVNPPPPSVSSSAPAAPVAPAISPAADEELPLHLNLESDREVLGEFINESREHLDNIEQGALVLENQPSDAEVLNTIFRAFHTFKGSAGFLNLVPINRLAHLLESLLDLARQEKLTLDASIIELILQGRDLLRQFLTEIEMQVNGTRPAAPILIPTAALKKEVQAVIDAVNAGKVPVVASKVSSPGTTSAAPSSVEHSTSVKVDTEKLDGLLDLVGEMVIAQSLVGRDLEQLASLNPQSARNVTQLTRITRELQRVGMSLRMVPVRGLFQKMARVVRDIGAKQNKRVNFVTSGEDTELDRSVVEELADPLLHMIRNSMDHGIETEDKRVAAGKTAREQQHNGSDQNQSRCDSRETHPAAVS